MTRTNTPRVSLTFPLAVENGWPPVAAECLPFEKSDQGYCALTSPLFVRDLSVHDIIAVELGEENIVNSWRHVHCSKRTTIWLLRLKQTTQIEHVLTRLRDLGCNSGSADVIGCYAIDVPEFVSMLEVDAVLSSLDSEAVAIAFPSMRHPECPVESI